MNDVLFIGASDQHWRYFQSTSIGHFFPVSAKSEKYTFDWDRSDRQIWD